VTFTRGMGLLLLWIWCGVGWCVVSIFGIPKGVFSRAPKILLGDMVCSSFKWLFLVNSA